MEWVWVVILFAVVLGPVAYALTFGRRHGAPSAEDETGATAIGELIRQRDDPSGLP